MRPTPRAARTTSPPSPCASRPMTRRTNAAHRRRRVKRRPRDRRDRRPGEPEASPESTRRRRGWRRRRRRDEGAARPSSRSRRAGAVGTASQRRDADRRAAGRHGLRQRSPVRRRGRARRLGVFAAVVALMLCVLWAALIGTALVALRGRRPGHRQGRRLPGRPVRPRWRRQAFTLVHVSRIPAATCRRRGAGASSTTPCAPASRRAPSSRKLEQTEP